MAVSCVGVLPLFSDAQHFLQKAVPLLQKFCDDILRITNQPLVIEKKIDLPEALACLWQHIFIRMKFPAEFVKVVRVGRHRNPSGERAHNITSPEEALSLCQLVSVYNHKLERVIEKELSVAKEFKTPESSVSRKVSKLTELSRSIDEFTKVLDKVIKYCATKSSGLGAHDFTSLQLPSLEELKDKKRVIHTLRSQLKATELHSLFAQYDEEFKTTDENIMCAILGLNDCMGDCMFQMDLDMRRHQTDLYFLKRFIEDKEDVMEAEEILEVGGRQGLLRNLQELSFTWECAVTISNSIPDEFVDLQKPSFWAERYLEYSFAHHPLIHQLPRYPYNQDTVDSWFDWELSLEKRIEPEESENYDKEKWSVKMINLPTSETKRAAQIGEFLRSLNEDGTGQLLFHGTTHQGAVSILEDGITLSAGKNGQDFSSGDGFYLSEEFENAEQWSKAGRGQYHAVIVFKVEQSMLDAESNSDYIGLDLSEDVRKWQEVVGLCRKQYSNKRMKRQLLKDVSFIKGPVCSNPRQKGDGVFEKQDCMQFCVRDEEFAEKLGSSANISAVVFY